MWRGLRRVHADEQSVDFARMAPDEAPWFPAWQAALSDFLAATPLTDLANAGRYAPVFRWTGATLALIGTTTGRNLARRALLAADAGRTREALAQATGKVEGTDGGNLAAAFLAELYPD
jgi:hypothetical protein